MTGTWMHNHSLRLIYHHQIFILIKDVQWNILRKNIRLCQLRNGKKDLILLLYLIIGLYLNPIYGYFLVLQQFLYIRSGKICIFFCKITVDPKPTFLFGYAISNTVHALLLFPIFLSYLKMLLIICFGNALFLTLISEKQNHCHPYI